MSSSPVRQYDVIFSNDTNPKLTTMKARVLVRIDDSYGYIADALFFEPTDQRILKAPGEDGYTDVKKHSEQATSEKDVLAQMQLWLLENYGVNEFIATD